MWPGSQSRHTERARACTQLLLSPYVLLPQLSLLIQMGFEADIVLEPRKGHGESVKAACVSRGKSTAVPKREAGRRHWRARSAPSSGVKHVVCNVRSSQWLDALVHRVCLRFVPAKAHDTELGLHGSWADGSHSHLHHTLAEDGSNAFTTVAPPLNILGHGRHRCHRQHTPCMFVGAVSGGQKGGPVSR